MKKTTFTQLFYFLLGMVGITLLWALGAMALNQSFLPTPWATLKSFSNLMDHYDLGKHFAISTYRIVTSLLLATAFGAPLGYLCGRYESVNKWVSPYISFLYPLPKIVFLPVIIVLFGLGNASKILLITLIICFQIVVIIRDEAMKIPKEWVLTMKTLTRSH